MPTKTTKIQGPNLEEKLDLYIALAENWGWNIVEIVHHKFGGSDTFYCTAEKPYDDGKLEEPTWP